MVTESLTFLFICSVCTRLAAVDNDDVADDSFCLFVQTIVGISYYLHAESLLQIFFMLTCMFGKSSVASILRCQDF